MFNLQAIRKLTPLLILAASAGAKSATPGPRQPDYYPTCGSPQPSAPAQMAGGSQIPVRSSTVWNGQEYGVAWVDQADSRLHFRRFFSDGTAVAPAVLVTARFSTSLHPPSMVWNGAGYAVAWSAVNTSYYQIYVARLNPDGSLIGTETKASFVGLSETANAGNPSLAWNGSGYAVTWDHDAGATSNDIFATLMNPDGTIANGGISHDLVISNAPDVQIHSSVAWSAGARNYVIVWADHRALRYQIYGDTLTVGGLNSGSVLLVAGVSDSDGPQLADTGGILGLVWHDFRDSNPEIYFARITGSLVRVGPDVRLTNDPFGSYWPRIAWTGAEFGVIWQESRTGPWEAWFQRVSVDGVPQGGNLQVSHAGNGVYPDIAFGRYGYLVTWAIYSNTANQVQAWGCNTVTSPPSCPGNFNAYNITGTSASVTWSPSGDPLSDIAYYQVYRNNVAVGKSSAAYYNDSGLPLSSTNNYMIQPVNAYQLQNYACTGSIYVRTNAFLTLTLNKAAPDAVLNWTDAGFNSYNVFRGNDPRVMSQIGATPTLTAPDPNALNNSVSYFYSVDNPGP